MIVHCTHFTIMDLWKDGCIVVHWYIVYLCCLFICTNKQCIYMARHLTTTYMFEVFWPSSSCHCHMSGLESRRKTTRVKKNAMTKGCLYSGHIYAGGVGKDTWISCLFWWFFGVGKIWNFGSFWLQDGFNSRGKRLEVLKLQGHKGYTHCKVSKIPGN